MGTLFISLAGLFVISLVVLQWKKPELYEKYYMPEVVFRNETDQFAFRVYSFPFKQVGYLRYKHRIDNVSTHSLQSRINWMDRYVGDEGKSRKEFAEKMIHTYLLHNEPRVFDRAFGDNATVDKVTYDDIKKDKLKKEYKHLEKLLEEENEDDYLDEWNKLKDNSTGTISNKQYTNYE